MLDCKYQGQFQAIKFMIAKPGMGEIENLSRLIEWSIHFLFVCFGQILYLVCFSPLKIDEIKEPVRDKSNFQWVLYKFSRLRFVHQKNYCFEPLNEHSTFSLKRYSHE
jgi:hypothetical protein